MAGVTLFVLSRLYIALGSDDGPPKGRKRTLQEQPVGKSDPVMPQINREPIFNGPGAKGLLDIYRADNAFNVDDFIKGSREAYKMILAAFASGDRDTLKPLLDEDVYEAWDKAITERKQSGAPAYDLLRIRKLEIDDAELDGQIARIMVRYEAELSDGENMTSTRDIWTYKRNVSQSDPNWVLDDVSQVKD